MTVIIYFGYDIHYVIHIGFFTQQHVLKNQTASSVN